MRLFLFSVLVLFASQLAAQFCTVDVQFVPAGSGTVMDNFGIVYPSAPISYTNGSTITFTATPNSGFTFQSWSGTPPASTANPRSIDLSPWNNQSITLTANFSSGTSAPTVTTPTSSAIATTSATLGGNVVSDGGSAITGRGVVYALTSVNPTPQIGGTGVTQATTTGTTGVFTVGVSGLTTNSAYSFAAYAINAVGTSYTTTGNFTTLDPPAISQHPQSQSIGLGQTATLTVTASGNPSPSYQWYEGTASSTTTPVGTNSNSYTTPALSTSTSYWVRVSNSAGSVDSNTATISVQPGVSIGTPSVASTTGGPVDFVITYTNATAVTLSVGDITVTPTGTAAGTASVSGTGVSQRTVTLSGITGDGTLTITIAAGTASNGAGSAPGAGPSVAVTVDNTDPSLTPGAAVQVANGATNTGATVGTVSDTTTAAGNLIVTATSVPAGLTVANIVNSAGAVTADISASVSIAAGGYVVGFTVTDEAGNTGTANLAVDVLANTAPTISVVAAQTIPMNTATGTLAVTVDDLDEGAAALILTATSNNLVLVDDNTDILLGGAGTARTVIVTPQTNGVGVALITLTITDSLGASTSGTFTVTVTDTVNAPSLDVIADQVIFSNQTSAAVNFTANDPQGAGTLNAPTALSSNPTLILPGDVDFSGTAPNLSFQITPQAGQTGTAVITIAISDGTFTASRSFTVTVQAAPGGGGNGGGGGGGGGGGCTAGNSGLGILALLALMGMAAVFVRTRVE